ncbi:MAG TPA: YfhO family protein [Thermoanaerobaculia bacterium]|nr:YfhO family protein [Thermoanaerobaculia bacterium]
MNAAWLLVGVVYAMAVWLARRAGTDLPRRVATLFYLLVLLLLFRPLTQSYADFPADVVRLLAPWSALNPIDRTAVSNEEMQDLTMQVVPWAHQVRESWRSGQVPLWNALSGSGHPLLANGQSAALSPLRLIALPLPLAAAMSAEAAMKMLIALTFTFLFCRRFYGLVPSLIGAVSFGLGSFIAVWLHFPLGAAAAFFPAVLYTSELLFEKFSRGRLIAFVIVATSTIFMGHPETAAHIAFFALLYLLWVAIVTRSWKPFGRIAAGSVLAFLVASPFIVPFAEAVRESNRFHEVAVGERGVIAYSDPKCAIQLIAPRFYGGLRWPFTWGPASAESVTGFAGILGLAGVIALVTRAVMRRRWRERELFWAAIVVLLFLITLDWAPVSEPFRALFSYSANARVRFALAFFAAVAAAAAIDGSMRERKVPLLIGLAGAAAVLLTAFSTMDFPPGAMRQSLLVTVPSIAVLGCALFVRRVPELLLIAVAFELAFATHDWRPDVPLQEMYPRTPLIEAVERLDRRGPDEPPFRFTGINSPLFPNTNAMFGMEDPRVHDPMANDAYIRILGLATDYPERAYFRKLMDPRAPILDYLNVRYMITEPGVELDRPRVYDGPDGRIYENRDVLPRFFPIRNVFIESSDETFEANIRRSEWRDHAFLRAFRPESEEVAQDLLAPRPASAPEATLRITRAEGSHFRMTVDAPRHTLVVSSQTFWPGWRVETATARLRPIRVNGAFLGFVVPPGVSEVRVRYVPMSFYASAVVSILTLVALVIPSVARDLGAGRRLSRTHQPPDSSLRSE